MSIKGFEDVNHRFRSLMDEIRVSRTRRAVNEVAIEVNAEAATMTPVDTSFLINSAYTRDWRTFSGWEGEVGYGAHYAKFVHNASGKLKGTPRANGNGNYWDPSGEPRFLDKAVTAVRYDLPKIIANQYRA